MATLKKSWDKLLERFPNLCFYSDYFLDELKRRYVNLIIKVRMQVASKLFSYSHRALCWLPLMLACNVLAISSHHRFTDTNITLHHTYFVNIFVRTNMDLSWIFTDICQYLLCCTLLTTYVMVSWITTQKPERNVLCIF